MADNPAKNLRRQYEGKIIFISSIAGLITDPFAGAYSSSKHALEAVASALSQEVKEFGNPGCHEKSRAAPNGLQ
ncbi:SDR family NAD(P)-dependent oxidoreductase [Kozakia baliensis]|uniref:SDR family NAD(P)-dependent oxidoreductase n=1 Tax=Kozakia baliensis TaxID=153496 RepID=UPI000A554006|nr:SDR family NAD(P)-dependent oxidoreductase [Kozakia baliensis]